MKALKIGNMLSLNLGFKGYASKLDSQPVAHSKYRNGPITFLLVDVATSQNNSDNTIDKETTQS